MDRRGSRRPACKHRTPSGPWARRAHRIWAMEAADGAALTVPVALAAAAAPPAAQQQMLLNTLDTALVRTHMPLAWVIGLGSGLRNLRSPGGSSQGAM